MKLFFFFFHLNGFVLLNQTASRDDDNAIRCEKDSLCDSIKYKFAHLIDHLV